MGRINEFIKNIKDILKKEEDMEDINNIESYDGDDAFYSGTDEEYEEFLKSVDGKMNTSEEAEPVENTQKINLGDTINIQGVLDKFREKAGEFSTAAKNVKEDIAGKIEDFKAATAEKKEDFEDGAERTGSRIVEEIKNIDVEGIKNQISSGIKDSAAKFSDFKDGITSITERFDETEAKLSSVSEKLDGVTENVGNIAERLGDMGVQNMDNARERAANEADIKHTVGTIADDTAEIKQAVINISKLSDSVFDLKNAQMNTKNSLAEMELAFIKLKRKCIAGITILSIIGLIIVALEVLQILF